MRRVSRLPPPIIRAEARLPAGPQVGRRAVLLPMQTGHHTITPKVTQRIIGIILLYRLVVSYGLAPLFLYGHRETMAVLPALLRLEDTCIKKDPCKLLDINPPLKQLRHIISIIIRSVGEPTGHIQRPLQQHMPLVLQRLLPLPPLSQRRQPLIQATRPQLRSVPARLRQQPTTQVRRRRPHVAPARLRRLRLTLARLRRQLTTQRYRPQAPQQLTQ